MKERLRCLNRLCEDAFIAGRRNIRKASPYGPQKRSRWLCSSCGVTFSSTKINHLTFRLRKPNAAQRARRLHAGGLTVRRISTIVGASRSSVSRWIKKTS